MVVAERLDRLTLISGPAGGGKSRWAEHLAAVSARPVVYCATGPQCPDDEAWQQRLQRHRQRRPPHWRCLETGGDLCEALASLGEGDLALVDSLGTWVAAHLQADRQAWWDREQELLAVLARPGPPVLMVAEECGWGVVPPTAEGLRFRERLAGVQQKLAERCSAAWLVLQGRALDLHQLGQAVPPEA
ncbi:MAG: bifunctional adenosylcobinamide kinase/adenosylcobinamide-phosphate guanylyltransferase [Cyanobium sp.]